MYTPQQFEEKRPEVLAGAIREIQFALLVTSVDGTYHATHLPMLLKAGDGVLTLEAHLARANPHWQALGRKPASLAVFQGPQTYISPSWYESKRRHGKVVPTWNYVVVHAHGPLEAVEDRRWLRAHIEELVARNERGRDPPWAVSDAPAEFVEQMTRAIVGLRLKIERLEGKWKMSQNRPEADRLGTLAGLSGSADPRDQAVARVMRAREAERG